MQKICANTWCRSPFAILPEDEELLKKFHMPAPTLCPDCRHQRRAASQIALKLYPRFSALSGDPLLTIFHPRKPFAVYSIDEWWSDRWDPKSYGHTVDFSRSFFEQIEELYTAVPHMATFNEGCENCDYCASAGQSKNCYYCRTVHRSEHCYYSEMVTGYNEHLCDCLRCQRSSFLYECIQCVRCHHSAYLLRCNETRDSYFCIDLHGCSNCLFCSNLRNKEYCIRNKQATKEAYQQEVKKVMDGREGTMVKNLQEFGMVYMRTVWKAVNNINCERCIGDGLMNASDCYQCFYCFNAHNCRYCWMMTPSEQCIDAMDITRGGIGELLYSCTGLGGGNYFMRMCVQCRKSSDLTYCIECFYSKNCFGCVGLKHAEYCILNRQYKKEEYEALLPRIIAHMEKTKEWGEFFPPSMAPYPYNDSLGSVYFPLRKEDALARGFQWQDSLPLALPGTMRNTPLPKSIDDVSDELCDEIVSCAQTGRPFKFIKQELAFYRNMRLPLPRLHPDIRMGKRMSTLTSLRLWKRTCMKCGKGIETTYSPERPEKVYCEECYLKEVY